MMLLLLAAEVLTSEWFNRFLLQIMCSCLVNLPPPRYPPRNKGLITSLIEGNQWLIRLNKDLFLRGYVSA